MSTRNLRKRQRSALDYDYDEGALRAMSYSELRNQPFDVNPAAQKQQLQLQQQQQKLQQEHPILGSRGSGASLGSAAGGGNQPSLEDSLAAHKRRDELDQQRFFGSLTVDEWECSGDWFVEQFAAVVARLREARQARRRVFASFESEIHAREEVVKGRVDAIGQTLVSMREDGQMLMRGKNVNI